MNRNEFLSKLGIGVVLVCAGNCLSSCSKDETGVPENVDFTLDLTAAENQKLQAVGGFLVRNKLIIARTNTTTYVALSVACTHEGTEVTYQSGNKQFNCPNHGSNFTTDGSVINGPARRALTKYQTTLNGNNLRIFS